MSKAYCLGTILACPISVCATLPGGQLHLGGPQTVPKAYCLGTIQACPISVCAILPEGQRPTGGE